MIKPFVLILCIIISTTIFSQNCALTNERVGGVFYVGVRNEISCTVEGYACSSVVLSTKNGTIKHFEECRFFYFPDHVADDSITISIKKSGQLKKLSVHYVRIRTSKPIATIGGFTDKYISKGAFSAQTGVGAYLSYLETGMCINYTVVSFTLIVMREGKPIFTSSHKNNLFNDEAREFFKTLQNLDVVMLSSICVMMENNKKMIIDPLEYIIFDETPVALIDCGFGNGHLNKAVLLAQSGIGAYSESSPMGFEIRCDWRVKSFHISIMRDGNALFDIEKEGNDFNSQEITNAFRSLQKNDTVRFTSIVVTNRDGKKEQTTKPLEIIID